MDGAGTEDADSAVAQRGRKRVKAKARLVPPLFRLVIDSKVQNPFLELLLPGQRATNTAAFTAEFNDLLKSGHSLGLTESTLIQVDEYHLPPLHWSAVLGCTIAVQELLKNGYNPLLKVKDSGRTALHCVALYGPMARWHVNDTERVFKKIVPLLSNGLYVQDNELATPFHLIALGVTGDSRVKLYESLLHIFLRQLVDHRERARDILNLQDRQGNTMLHYLAESPLVSETILMELLSYGISSNVQNKEGQTAFDVSSKSGNKIITEIFTPGASNTVTQRITKREEVPNPKRPKVHIPPEFQGDRISRMRRKPSRYDPTFHDEVPKFLQLEVTKSKRVHRKTDKEKNKDDTDSSSSVQGKAVEVTNSKRAVPKESSTASSSSLQVQSVQKPSANAQQSDLPLQSSDPAKSSSHAGLSHQQLLPLLESLVACGLWEQLTDLATRMKQELEQEKHNYKQRLEVTAASALKVQENLQRCSGEMERLHKEVGSLHRTDSQLNEQKQVIVGKVKEIDDKISKLDCFVKKATSTVRPV